MAQTSLRTSPGLQQKGATQESGEHAGQMWTPAPLRREEERERERKREREILKNSTHVAMAWTGVAQLFSLRYCKLSYKLRNFVCNNFAYMKFLD